MASSSFDSHESETVTITAITGSIITFTPKLKFNHFSAVEDYGGIVKKNYFFLIIIIRVSI